MENNLKNKDEINLIGLFVSSAGHILILVGILLGGFIMLDTVLIGGILMVSSLFLGLLFMGIGEVIRLLQILVVRYKSNHKQE